MSTTAKPAAPIAVPINHAFDPFVKVKKNSPATKFKAGDTFTPYGMTTVGLIDFVSENGGTVRWSYDFEPETKYSGTKKELLTIIGLDK